MRQPYNKGSPPSGCCPTEDLPNMARSRQVRLRNPGGAAANKGEARRQRRAASGNSANRLQISRLRSGDQIRKAASVVLAEDQADSDESWNRGAVPLCLPPLF